MQPTIGAVAIERGCGAPLLFYLGLMYLISIFFIVKLLIGTIIVRPSITESIYLYLVPVQHAHVALIS